MDTLLNHYGLNQIAPAIRRYASSANGFYLTADKPGRSRFGGSPLLPTDFAWPYYTPMRFELPGADLRPLKAGEPRALDFLLQIDLADLHGFAPSPLPASGLLSFFYDIENQPWGYDPAHLDGFKVLFFEDNRLAERLPPGSPLEERVSSFLSQ